MIYNWKKPNHLLIKWFLLVLHYNLLKIQHHIFQNFGLQRFKMNLQLIITYLIINQYMKQLIDKVILNLHKLILQD